MSNLTLLYDPDCGLCRRVQGWLAEQPRLVELRMIPIKTDGAKRRFPELNHELTSEDLTVISEHGYEKTTMRAIARRAGVSLGNAYHYFSSKEHLIQAFYHRTHEEHLAGTRAILKSDSGLKTRLLNVMRLKISTLEPYHEFAG